MVVQSHGQIRMHLLLAQICRSRPLDHRMPDSLTTSIVSCPYVASHFAYFSALYVVYRTIVFTYQYDTDEPSSQFTHYTRAYIVHALTK